MKFKLLIGSVVGMVFLGGVLSVSAFSESDNNVQVKSGVEVRKTDNKKVRITKEEAIAIATKASPGKVVEVELDDGIHYEIEIKNSTQEIEYKIDAYTGKILEKDVDLDDDWYDDKYDD